MKVFTATILSQNYHWTDGFFVKNHPLKEAEKQYKFCFWVKVEKGMGEWTKACRTGPFQAKLVNGIESCNWKTLT